MKITKILKKLKEHFNTKEHYGLGMYLFEVKKVKLGDLTHEEYEKTYDEYIEYCIKNNFNGDF